MPVPAYHRTAVGKSTEKKKRFHLSPFIFFSFYFNKNQSSGEFPHNGIRKKKKIYNLIKKVGRPNINIIFFFFWIANSDEFYSLIQTHTNLVRRIHNSIWVSDKYDNNKNIKKMKIKECWIRLAFRISFN